jgi:single-stranded-DNA-specific exonuclease
VDVALEPDLFDLPSASDLSQLEPLGAANIEPLFLLPAARVVECGVVLGAHLKLELQFGGRALRAFGYDMAASRVAIGDTICALGQLRRDSWMGGERVELRLQEIEPV